MLKPRVWAWFLKIQGHVQEALDTALESACCVVNEGLSAGRVRLEAGERNRDSTSSQDISYLPVIFPVLKKSNFHHLSKPCLL